MILTIIIPMYNVEKYIEKCLISCIKQDISENEYEIIVINDGSPDNSLRIAEKIAEKTNNINILSQTNCGLSAARNKGLLLAKGKYIWFIDSDDWIEENCLSDLVVYLNTVEPDILQLQYRNCYDNNLLNKSKYSIINGVQTGKEQLINGGLPIPAQFMIYRREFLIRNNLYFYPGLLHEDCEFKPRVLYLANKCISFNKVVYNYYQRTCGSITSAINPQRAFDYIKVALSIDEFYKNIAKGDCGIFFHNHISLMINNALSLASGKKSEFSKMLCKNKHLFVHLRQSNLYKYKVEGWLFTLFPKHTVRIYNFLNWFK